MSSTFAFIIFFAPWAFSAVMISMMQKNDNLHFWAKKFIYFIIKGFQGRRKRKMCTSKHKRSIGRLGYIFFTSYVRTSQLLFLDKKYIGGN